MTDNEKLFDTLAEIADYIFSVCRENNLVCMLAYGTALGAYRHKDFIPWDDDMDVVMPREDYEKFIEIMKTKKDGYSIQNEDNEPGYFLSFAKVRKDNTLFREKSMDGLLQNNGIFVDIFPLDYVDDPSKLSYKLRAYYITYIKHILRVSSCPEVYKNKMSTAKYIVERCISLPAMFFKKKTLLKHLHAQMQSSGSKASAKYLAQYDEVLSRQIVPAEYYLPARKLEMRGRKYPAPGQIEKYLENFYGKTYMQLPPEEQRVTHTPLEIKF